MFAFQPERYVVHTEVFDGPLELLLYLIRRDGIDVRDIPISHVTREYIGYLDQMEVMDLDVAGDFLVMASVLCELKSRDLLPRASRDEEEEEIDPREELVSRLIEYERFRQASLQLSARDLLGRDVFSRPNTQIARSDRPVDPGVDSFGLLEAFYRVLESRAAEEPVHEIELEEYSLQERVTWVLRKLSMTELTDLRDVLVPIRGRGNRVITFLAILEMARLQMVNITQERHLGPVMLLLKIDAATADLSAIPNEA